jgi:hypothetical protein
MMQSMTSVKPIPEGYHTVTPYILVQGAEKLIDFMKKAFDAKESERYSMPDGSIGHAEVKIGDSVIMVSDAQGEEYKPIAAGIHLYVEDCDATYKRAIEAGLHLSESLRISFMVIEALVRMTSLVTGGGLLHTKKICQKKKLSSEWTML